ncbi:MAG: hypothetical protein ACLGJC_20320 [Alphaproteobacteria bacterium]
MKSDILGERASAKYSEVEYLIKALLSLHNQAAMIAFLEQAQRPIMSKALGNEIKARIKTLGGHIEAKRSREATATLLVLLFIDASYVLPRLRREGVLRASRYGYRGSLIGTVAKAALQIRPLMNASSERIRYLESVIALSKLATDARALYDEIVKILRSRRDRVLKTLLVILNNQFYSGGIDDRSQSSMLLRHYTKEEYAEGASLIFSIYSSLFAITDECCNDVDVAAIKGEAVYERLLLMAVRLTKFNDAEILIDGLPYKATISGETITIDSIDPEIERSVRLGYIQNENQVAIRMRDFHKSDQSEIPISVGDIIEKGFENETFEALIELVEQPVRRYRLMLPTAPEVFSLFSMDYMLRDELERLLFLDVNSFGTISEQIVYVNEHVTTIDIFKLQRYFTFLSCVYQRKLKQVEDEVERTFLTFTSTVFVISHDNLFMQMMLIFKSEVKVRSLIDLLKMTISTRHIDLQYRPLVDLGSYYVVAPHLLAASNLARNTVVANGLRSTVLGPVDLMLKEVIEALRLADFKVEAGFKLRADGQDFELDIVAWRDGHLFFFECKNAYHPCSPHEMRNSYDHLKIGRDQLDKRRRTFSEPVHQNELLKKLGWAVEGTSNVHTGIIIANRVFHGATLNGHPVRQAHELINILTLGRVVGEEHSRSIWAGSEFHASDLVTYLEGDSLATKQLYALEPANREFAMGYRRLVFASYVLDLRTQYRIMEASYPIV